MLENLIEIDRKMKSRKFIEKIMKMHEIRKETFLYANTFVTVLYMYKMVKIFLISCMYQKQGGKCWRIINITRYVIYISIIYLIYKYHSFS